MEEVPSWPFGVAVERSGGTVRATLSGELDLVAEPEVVAAVERTLDGSGSSGTEAAALVVDLRSVTFIDSSGLRAVLVCREAACDRGLSFLLAVDGGPVRRLLDAAGVADWFDYE